MYPANVPPNPLSQSKFIIVKKISKNDFRFRTVGLITTLVLNILHNVRNIDFSVLYMAPMAPLKNVWKNWWRKMYASIVYIFSGSGQFVKNESTWSLLRELYVKCWTSLLNRFVHTLEIKPFPIAPAFGVYISHILKYNRACLSYLDSKERHMTCLVKVTTFNASIKLPKGLMV